MAYMMKIPTLNLNTVFVCDNHLYISLSVWHSCLPGLHEETTPMSDRL